MAQPTATAHLWDRRDLLVQLVRRQVRRRYAGHLLGRLWPFLNPLALLATYTLVFSVFLRADYGAVNADWAIAPGVRGHLQFAVLAYAGILAFTYFADVAASAPRLVLGEPAYVKRTVFPLEVLAPVGAAAALIETAVGFALLLAAQTLWYQPPGWTLALLPLALLPLVLLALAAGWTLAALGTYVPDLHDITGIALRFLFFLTPVVYPIEVVPGTLRAILALNPLASILHGIRLVTLWNRPLLWDSWALATLTTALLAWASLRLFRRLRPGFADVM